MPTLVGPSHHLFYGALHRRRLWLGHLASAFAPFATATWDENKSRLDANFKRTFVRLSVEPHLGILKPLPLVQILDDTPIESFLVNLSDDLDAYQHNLLELMQTSVARQGWFEELERVSMLFGRELAQECVLAKSHGKLVRGTSTVRGLFEAIHNIVQGGDFVWKPFLVRRYTDFELQYELRNCPHSKAVTGNNSDHACKLEAMVIRGFSEALLADVSFGRKAYGPFCMDELRLPR